MYKWIIAAFASVVCAAGAAHGLEFALHPNNKSATLTAVLATGEIVPGDTDRLLDFLNSIPRKTNTAIYLASGGGDLYCGIRCNADSDSSARRTAIR